MTDHYSTPQFRGGVLLTEMSAPSTPPSGTMALFAGTDGYLYYKNDAGTTIGLLPPPQFAIYQTSVTNVDVNYEFRVGWPSLSVNVPNSGRVECTWGLVGNRSISDDGCQIWVDVAFTAGANSRAAADANQAAAIFGQGNSGVQSVEKSNLFEGLNPGATTMQLQARRQDPSPTVGTHTLYEMWLFVQVYP